MDRLKELKEAKSAAKQVLDHIDSAVRSLNSASSWGIWDIFGGGFISSMIKRNKIELANAEIQAMNYSLKNLNKELEDVNMHLPSEISNTLADNVFDVWFDNIFTDIRVQSEIKNALFELQNFRGSLLILIKKIDSEIAAIE